jgi:hypothetical protein
MNGQDHGARAQEEQGLEEGMRAQMKQGRCVAPTSRRQQHVAELAHGRVGEHLLDVGLVDGDRGGEERGQGSHPRHHRRRARRQRVQEGQAAHHVDTGRHHGGGVDQRRDRRRAGHGVGQPRVEGNLGRLAAGPQEEAQGRDLQHLPVGAEGHPGGHRDRLVCGESQVLLQVRKRHRRRAAVGKGPEDQEDSQQEAEVSDPVDDERLAAAVGVEAIAVPEADEKVGTQAHTLPAHEHEQEVVGQNQHQHREGEQVQVAEEALESAVLAVVVVHVADRIDVDERAHAGHDQDHHRRDRVQGEGQLCAEGLGFGAAGDPRVEGIDQEPRPLGQRQQLPHHDAREHEREAHRAARQRDGEPARRGPAKQTQRDPVEGRRHQRQQRDPAQELRGVVVFVHGLTT